MGRKAGNDTDYRWVLLDKSNGRYVEGEDIDLPSVTSIIKAVYAKFLDGWQHSYTLEILAAALQQLDSPLHPVDADGFRPWDLITDGEALTEWVKENKLRPQDHTDARADEGHVYHEKLEELADRAIIGDFMAQPMAEAWAAGDDGTLEAIGKWYLKRRPRVVASEQVVRSLRRGFAGTLDLAYEDEDGRLGICDLKSRNYKGGVWDSDRAQVGGLRVAYEEHKGRHVDFASVLVARDNGTFKEEVVDMELQSKIFLGLNLVYQAKHAPKEVKH